MQEMRFLEDLRAGNLDTELWWDSSPSLLPGWLAQLPGQGAAGGTPFHDTRYPLQSLVGGATTNPRLVADCIQAQPDRWQAEAHRLIDEMPYAPLQSIYWRLYKSVLGDGAAVLRPLWEASDGRYGWVSAQVDPRDFHDSQRMVQQGVELSALGPNVMVKVPGSAAGYDAIEQLVTSGISVNGTFSYTLSQLRACLGAIESGLRRRRSEPARWRSVFTFMIGRFGSQGDLVDQAHTRGMDLAANDIRWAEIAMFRKMLATIDEAGVPVKLLLSSIKADPGTDDDRPVCWHLEKTAGTPVVYTLTPTLLRSLMAGRYELAGLDRAEAAQEPVPAGVLSRLMALPYFTNAYAPDGLDASAFHQQGAFIATAAEACASVRRMHDFIARAFQARQWRRAGENVPAREREAAQLTEIRSL